MIKEILPVDSRPILLVVIDTEEELDWHKPLTRYSRSTEHLAGLSDWQSYFEKSCVKPCYVCDFPITENPAAMEKLAEYHRAGTAELGAHCHPWVNPPYKDPPGRKYSYPGNLPESLEREKIILLTEALTKHLGETPTTYKAGRYGRGPATANILSSLGYNVDLSPCPAFDFRGDGGPDYRYTNSFPDINESGLLTVPTSSAFVGWGGPLKAKIDPLSRCLKKYRVPGFLSCIGFSDRLMLSPEGYSSAEHKILTQYLYNQGHRVFSFVFHSPSWLPGYTPYVKSEADLTEFKRRFDNFFDFFFNTMNGVAMTPAALFKECTK